MAMSKQTRLNFAYGTALRGVLMLLGGIYAVALPGPALAVLVVVGGTLLLIDGVIGLWSLTFGGEKTGNYWFDVVRNVLAVITGVLILISPFLATLLTVTFLVYLVAIQCIFVGAMEIFMIIRERASYARIWPVLLSGIAYVLFGLVLLFAPMLSAVIFTVLGGALMIVFAIGLFGLAWRMYRSAKDTPASGSAGANGE